MTLSWRDLTRWAPLLASVAAAGFVAWWTYSATIGMKRLGERSVIETTALLVREKVDRVEQTIIAGDNAVFHLVNPDDLEVLASRWPGLADRISPAVRSVMVLDEQQRLLRHVSRGSEEDQRRFQSQFNQRLRGELHLSDEASGGHRHWHGLVAGQWVLVSYFTRETAGRRYFVLVETDLDYVRRELLPRLFDDPLARGRYNVTDENNRIVLGKVLADAGDFLVSRIFPTTLYKWRLALAPRTAPELEARSRRQEFIEAGYVVLSLIVILGGVAMLTWGARKAERLNLLKSDFIATVSHELKTPLSLIKMFGEMLSSERVATPEKRRQYLDIIVRESERLTGLIDNVLDFERVERGRASYEFVEADFSEVILRGIEMFRYRVDRQRPELVVDVATGLPHTRLDERAIQLVLYNLLDNAMKYAASSDQIIVRVRGDGKDLSLEVEDHGPGIDPEDARRIFERFFRGSAARAGSARGSGIGLALVKHIARAHGGDITVHEAIGGGSVFSLTLPVLERAPEGGHLEL